MQPQQEKPKKRDWKEIAEESREALLWMEQQMDLQRAILTLAESHCKSK